MRPSSVSAVTSRSSGRVSLSTINEWYRVASKGFGNDLKMPLPSCLIKDVFPCITAGARITLPPKNSPIHCNPRQTPKIGIFSLNSSINSMEIPESSGVPGPGLIRIVSGSKSETPSVVNLSLRNTMGLRPSSPRYWARIYTNES